MELEKRRDLALGIIILLIIVGGIVYFLWGNLINRGTIEISGDAPFSVEILGVETVNCETSPCEITQKMGEKSLIVYKEGYQSEFLDIDVKLWRTVTAEVKFQLLPHLVSASAIPAEDEIPQYELVFDEEKGMQKLVGKGSMEAIVYFQKSISLAKIFPSKRAVLLVTNQNEVYRVDTAQNARTKIAEPLSINDGKWSPNGKYFVYSNSLTTSLTILDENNEIKETPLHIPLSQTAWNYNNELIFFTDQGTQSEGQYSKFLDEKIPSGYNFGFYYPKINQYKKLETFNEITVAPTNIVPTSNGSAVYFQSGDQILKLILPQG